MNCNDTQAKLAEDLLIRFEDDMVLHLRSCDRCRAYCDELLELEDLSRTLGSRCKVPEDFRSEVLGKVGDKKHFSLNSPTLRLSIAGLIILLVSVGFFSPWTDSGRDGTFETLKANSGDSVDLGFVENERFNDPLFIEVIIDETPENEFILRLPSEIEIRETELHEDFYINHVSH